MKTKLKTILIKFMAICFVSTMFFGASGCFHPAPLFNIGNSFSETAYVYFNGDYVGKISSNKTKIFWPSEKVSENGDITIELKSNSGEQLFSKKYTWNDIKEIVEVIHGNPYWIGPETK